MENAALAVGTAGHLRVSLRDPGGAGLRVEDVASVPEVLRARLFEPFVSGRGRDAPRPGTGLGLAIARGVASRHGGSIVLDPRPSPLGGACFVIALPAEPPLPAGG